MVHKHRRRSCVDANASYFPQQRTGFEKVGGGNTPCACEQRQVKGIDDNDVGGMSVEFPTYLREMVVAAELRSIEAPSYRERRQGEAGALAPTNALGSFADRRRARFRREKQHSLRSFNRESPQELFRAASRNRNHQVDDDRRLGRAADDARLAFQQYVRNEPFKYGNGLDKLRPA